MSTDTMTSSHTRTSGKQAPCRCHDETPSRPQCCQIVCFDRPNYFCGHLLTDGDLSLGQRYVIEKNKLYHRALHGYGVVCGLKITCDSQCHGHVLIHDGFAIDDCGNDLVVCDTMRFDVIGALKRKKLLVAEPRQEDCGPYREKPDCDIEQCFYITICYDEQEGEYETPFQSACTSGPKECLPTRIRERVRFDVIDKLPRRHSFRWNLERRLKCCFEIYCDGPIGRLIKDNLKELQALVSAAGSTPQATEHETGWTDPCDLFCALRAHFLHQLEQKPDEFNCALFEEVSCLRCPDYEEGDETTYGEMGEAFRRLLVYMQQYQFDCAFGELLVPCPEPCEAHCLVLGTVEIRDGKLKRVCNSPREYLWAAANVVPVLVNNILTGGLETGGKGEYKWDTEHREHAEGWEHAGHGKHGEHKARCCPEYPNFLPEDLLGEFEYSECGRYLAATSVMKAFETVADALRQAFDFTDSRAISHEVLKKAAAVVFGGRSDPYEEKEVLGIKLSLSSEPASALSALNPLQAVLAGALARRNDSVVAYRGEGKIQRVLPDYFAEVSPEPDTVLKRYDTTIRELNEKIDALSSRVAELSDKKGKSTRGSSDKKSGGTDDE
jgi:hypothetical protein